jgi:GH24 family phage-related lysozyme (muramidase)
MAQPKVIWVAALGGFVTLLSPLLVAHIQQWESGPKRQLVAYADPLAGGLPTVCNGLTRHVTRTPIVVGERWTEDKCVAEEAAALERVQRALLPCFRRLPPPSVLDMASSHAWNLGATATCGSGAMTAWNRGEWERGCQRISRGDDGRMVWSFTSRIDPRTGDKVYTFVQGLANRRADETAKCSKDAP